MDVSESYTLNAPREQVWDTLLAHDTLQRSVPGCDSLEQTGDNAYAVHMHVTIPEIRGDYDGTLRLLDVQKPETYRMVVDSAGAHGTLHSDTALRLEARDADTTVVHCSGQARLGGAIATPGAEASEGTAVKLIRQSLDQLADLLPESSSVATAAYHPPTNAPILLPLPTPAKAERPARRRRTNTARPTDHQTAAKADQPGERNAGEPDATATIEAPGGSTTPRRRGGNSRQRSRKAEIKAEATAVSSAAEGAVVSEGADHVADADEEHVAPATEFSPPSATSADKGDAQPAPAEILPAPDAAPTPLVLDASARSSSHHDAVSPLAVRETVEPADPITASPSTGEQGDVIARRTIPWPRARVTVIDRSALENEDIRHGPKAADMLGVAIALTSVALTALLVWVLAANLH